MKLLNLIITSLLIGLFIFAIASFSIQLTTENNVNNSLMENQAFNSSFGDIQTELESAQSTAEEQTYVQEGTNPITSSGDLILESTPATAFSFRRIMRNIYGLTFGLLADTLGINPIIIYVMFSIFVITSILLVWRLIKVGE